ncbi:U2 snRNP-associated SURP motif-containing protein-like [Zophobas morio]|uniref:U2 snRNP-associated SURP motif-containing protein-like n=1 Tax=Zophobas morio TaxID=2755281 RepID=UPI00308279EC
MPFAQPLAVPGIPFAIPPIVPPVAANKPELDSAGSFPSNNNDTTNLYVGNLSPQVTEEILCMEFGVFGPLASVKIMWPRSAEEHSRGRNCGFVAFMNREDAAKSKDALDGKELLGYELRVGWGKCVTLPSQPFYVHKTIRDENTLTGLPFNARPLKDKRERDDLFSKVDLTALEQALYNSEISVPIPKDVTIRRLIHRTIEALVNEGALFEQVLMIKVARDPKFKFLFNYASPEHRYYRWKLYSVLQGDEVNSWRTTRFRMYEKGSFWVPPTLEEARLTEHVKKGQLTAKQRDELEDLLRNLTLARTSIKEAMGFCLENCEAAPEIVECITESLCILETPIQLKVARFFVVSDILNNTAMQGASYYRTQFEQTLPQIVGNLNSAYRAIPGRMRAELFKKNILNCIAAWEEWALYPFDFLNTLKTAFTAAPIKNASVPATASPAGEPEPIIQAHSAPVSSVDHVAPATALPGFKVVGSAEEEDIDGEDIVGSEDIDGEDIEGEDLLSKPKPEALKPGALSKWCSISDDEEAVNSK